MNSPALQIDHATQSATALHALLDGVATYPLNNRSWVRVSGEDRERWLNGMVTNSIQTLTVGTGCYNFLLNAQGRIEGDAYVFNTGDEMLIQTEKSQVDKIITWLDHYIIMDDVVLSPIENMTGIGVAGPISKSLIETTLPDALIPETLGITKPFSWRNAKVRIITAHSPLVPRYELWTSPEHITQLHDALTATDSLTANLEALECLRLLEGTPHYGIDIRNTEQRHELPQETAQSHALHFSKGCYLGQEIVERIRSRGNVHRTFSGFLVDGDAAISGSPIIADGKEVGEITSAACIPLTRGIITLALGYIRREALDRKAELLCDGNTISQISLPYTDI